MVTIMQRLAGVFLTSLSILLASCVSETTGGFNQALSTTIK